MLRLPEERYRSLFEQAPLGFLVAEKNGRIIAMNSTLQSLFGMEGTRKTYNVLTNGPLKKAGITNNFRFCITRGEAVISECDFRTRDGVRLYIQYYLTPFRDEKKIVSGVQAVVINATAQKEAQEEFLNIYNYVNRLVSSLSPLLTLDFSGKVQFVNESLLASFKLTREKAIGKDPGLILGLAPKERKALRENISESAKQTVSGREFKSGARTFGYSIFRFADNCGIILRDITETKRLERKVARLHTQLIKTQESERQKIASELHDGVGQTILAAKINFVAFQKNGEKFSDRFETGLDLIDRASADLREIYTNLYPSTLRDLGLESTIRWYARNVLEVRGCRVNLSFELERTIEADTELNLFRIMQELFANIIKHARATRVALQLRAGNGNVSLSIRDNGKGFSPGKARSESGGFGLENIRRRAEDLGGKFTIDSRAGRGSTFRIEIPEKTRGRV